MFKRYEFVNQSSAIQEHILFMFYTSLKHYYNVSFAYMPLYLYYITK